MAIWQCCRIAWQFGGIAAWYGSVGLQYGRMTAEDCNMAIWQQRMAAKVAHKPGLVQGNSYDPRKTGR